MKFFTKTITTPISISQSDGVYQISIQPAASSSADVIGSGNFQGLSPDAISLTEGQALTLSSNISTPIDGLTITPTGSVLIIIGTN